MDKNALASDDSNGYVNIVNGLNASELYTFFKKRGLIDCALFRFWTLHSSLKRWGWATDTSNHSDIQKEIENYIQFDTHRILDVFLTDIFMNINSQKQNLERIHAKFLSNFLLGEGILVFMDIQRDFELYTLFFFWIVYFKMA